MTTPPLADIPLLAGCLPLWATDAPSAAGLHPVVLALGSACLGVLVPTLEFAGFR